MNLRNMSTREQVLIFFVAFTVVVGGYGLLRYRPALKALAEVQAGNAQLDERAKNAVIPEEPVEDADDLKEDIADLDKELSALGSKMTEAKTKLATEDPLELRLRISDAAAASGVKIRDNVPYLIPRSAGVVAAPADAPKLSKRQQRNADRAARRAGAASGAASPAVTAIAPKEGELIYRLVNELEEPRPFQRISVEGSYAQLQSFVQALAGLPFLVTIGQIQIELSTTTAPAGYPQPLVATMILAL